MEGIDKIFVVSYVKNKNHRKNITKQLNYHGIYDFEFYYTYNVSEKIINNPNNLCNKHLSVSYAHYDIMKRCYELGYKRILVFEDDVMFLKDKAEFQNVLNEALTYKENIIFVDYRYEIIELEELLWFNLQSGYIVDRKGMKFYIDNFEKYPFLIDQYMYFALDFSNLKFYNMIYHDGRKPNILVDVDTTVNYVKNNLLCYQPLIIYGSPIVDIEKYFNEIELNE